MRWKTGIALAAAAAFGGGCASAPEATTVKVEQGTLQGVTGESVVAFLGVPFAAPPVGDLRWRPPAPAAKWAGVRKADHFGASCYQPYPAPSFGPYTKEFTDTPAPSEDCLFLNVWAPVKKGTYPVLVWIHGGGFIGGSGAVPIYDGANLAAKGAVVVSINYRVGPLGFLAHPALSAEDAHRSSGNYGLLDQIAALKWLKANVAQFGGDPANITIAGQSAGAASVDDLLVSPLAAGLFRQAVAESGSGMGVESPALSAAEKEGESFARYLGASTAAALRAVPAAKVQAAVYMPVGPTPPPADLPKIRFRPPVDGYVLTADPSDPQTPAFGKVPLLTGFNSDEDAADAIKTVADFEKDVRGRFRNHADKILSLYPHETDADARASAKLLARDRYLSSLMLWTEARAKGAGSVIYRYEFTQPVPVAKGPGFGAFHTAEVPYLFGNLDTSLRPYGDTDRAVANLVQGYWLNFARTGNPNGHGLPQWPMVTPGNDTAFKLGAKPIAGPAASSPERFAALRDFVADGGSLSLF
jgi:para-nitrobenzyl esterase